MIPVPDAAASPFFHLSLREWQVFVTYCRSINAPAGTLICARGASDDTLYLVQSGALVATSGPNATAPVRLGPGDCWGDTGFLHGTASPADVFADTYCELLSVSAYRFASFQREYPSIAGKVAVALARRATRCSPVGVPAPAAIPTAGPAPVFISRTAQDLLWA